MFVSKTPYRISLFGGGTDYPDYFNEFSGITVNFAISNYCTIFYRKTSEVFDRSFRLRYFQNEYVNKISDIKHPVIRSVFSEFDVTSGEVVHIGDLPAMTGIGSSSSFTVGLINVVAQSKGITLGEKDLAEKAIDIERRVLSEAGGFQDQIITAHGGIGVTVFENSNSFRYERFKLSDKNLALLNKSFVMVFTGGSRYSHDIAKQQSTMNKELIHKLHDIKSVAIQAECEFRKRKIDIAEIGSLLDSQWKIKRRVSAQISNQNIDELYEYGIKCGSLGGKLVGAGGGGFILFVVESSHMSEFLKNFDQKITHKISISNAGSLVMDTNRHF